jgi:hypothetical protein
MREPNIIATSNSLDKGAPVLTQLPESIFTCQSFVLMTFSI